MLVCVQAVALEVTVGIRVEGFLGFLGLKLTHTCDLIACASGVPSVMMFSINMHTPLKAAIEDVELLGA